MLRVVGESGLKIMIISVFLLRGKNTHFLMWLPCCFSFFVSCYKGIIQREETSMEKEMAGHHREYFHLGDVMYFAKKACEAVAEDEVTRRFSSEELLSWNLLSRTNANFHCVSWQLTVVWIIGILIRYCLLMPFRWARCNFLGFFFKCHFLWML